MVVGITTIDIGCTKRCAIGMLYLTWQMLLPEWLMFLPCFWLADVVAMWLMLLPLLVFCLLADVIARWLVLLPLLCSVVLADVVAMRLMECLPWV